MQVGLFITITCEAKFTQSSYVLPETKNSLNQRQRSTSEPRPEDFETSRKPERTRKWSRKAESPRAGDETVSKNKIRGLQSPSPSSPTSRTSSKKVSHNPYVLPKTDRSLKQPQNFTPEPKPEDFEPSSHQNRQEKNREVEPTRKRSREAESPRAGDEPAEKRSRVSFENRAVEGNTYNKKTSSVVQWIGGGSWPKEDFEEINISIPLARKKTFAALRLEELESSSITPSQKIESKSAPYKDGACLMVLEAQGSFQYEFNQGTTEDGRNVCQILLNTEQTVPQDSLFHDDLFVKALEKLEDRNEARIVAEIARLLVPCAETLTTHGATHLQHLFVGINERWNESIPVLVAHPQPDFCVGFRRSAFTDDQLKRLGPFTGNVLAEHKLCSFFLATYRMYFPFFTSEAKCGSGDLNIADRQNAHSMTVAVRGIFELFKYVKREKELHRKIVAFSISHDGEFVNIYGHYPVINENMTSFYRHMVRSFGLKDLDGKEKWTAYKFSRL